MGCDTSEDLRVVRCECDLSFYRAKQHSHAITSKV